MDKTGKIIKLENKVKELEKLIEEQHKAILKIETAICVLLDYNGESEIKIADSRIKEHEDSKKGIYFERDLSSNSWIIKEGIKF